MVRNYNSFCCQLTKCNQLQNQACAALTVPYYGYFKDNCASSLCCILWVLHILHSGQNMFLSWFCIKNVKRKKKNGWKLCNCFVIDKMKCILYNEFLMKLAIDINTMLCPLKVISNTIELTVHTSCYFVLDFLSVILFMMK